MKITAMAAAIGAVVLLFAGTTQSAEPITQADLQGSWMLTYLARGQPVACFFDVNKKGKGKGESMTAGSAGDSSLRAKSGTWIVGLLALGAVEGTLETTEPQRSFRFRAQVAKDTSTMAGLLITEATGEFFPVSVTRWVMDTK